MSFFRKKKGPPALPRSGPPPLPRSRRKLEVAKEVEEVSAEAGPVESLEPSLPTEQVAPASEPLPEVSSIGSVPVYKIDVRTSPRNVSGIPTSEKLGYFFFILLTIALFVRPSDLFASEFPLYMIFLSCCIFFTFPKLWAEFSPARIKAEPVSVCVLGVFCAIFVSHLSQANFGMAMQGANTFFKVAIYYFLMLCLINSSKRLKNFAGWLVALVFIIILLSLLQYHEMIDIPALAALDERQVDPGTGDIVVIRRLRGVGLFNDPNDLCITIMLGMSMSLFLLSLKPGKISRMMIFMAMGVGLFGLFATKSRGGFLCFLAGVGVWAVQRYGKFKTVLIMLFILPVLMLAGSERATNVNLDDKNDTAQHRIKLWNSGFAELKSSPLFGIGYGQYAEKMELVAHNSFIHAFTELGLFGGAFYVGMYYFLLSSLAALAKSKLAIEDPVMKHFPMFLTMALFSSLFGQLSLSRNYVVTSYFLPALATAYFRDLAKITSWRTAVFTRKLFLKLVGWSLVVLAVLFVFVRIFANYG